MAQDSLPEDLIISSHAYLLQWWQYKRKHTVLQEARGTQLGSFTMLFRKIQESYESYFNFSENSSVTHGLCSRLLWLKVLGSQSYSPLPNWNKFLTH